MALTSGASDHIAQLSIRRAAGGILTLLPNEVVKHSTIMHGAVYCDIGLHTDAKRRQSTYKVCRFDEPQKLSAELFLSAEETISVPNTTIITKICAGQDRTDDGLCLRGYPCLESTEGAQMAGCSKRDVPSVKVISLAEERGRKAAACGCTSA